MRQYTRIYCDSASTILHVHTQTTPITHEPVNDDRVDHVHDLVVDHDSDFQVARTMLHSLEVSSGAVRVRSDVTSGTLYEGRLTELTDEERTRTQNPTYERSATRTILSR